MEYKENEQEVAERADKELDRIYKEGSTQKVKSKDFIPRIGDWARFIAQQEP